MKGGEIQEDNAKFASLGSKKSDIGKSDVKTRDWKSVFRQKILSLVLVKLNLRSNMYNTDNYLIMSRVLMSRWGTFQLGR